ncbi:MAG: plasmid partitioning/stability family protein [Dialister invisus]
MIYAEFFRRKTVRATIISAAIIPTTNPRIPYLIAAFLRSTGTTDG